MSLIRQFVWQRGPTYGIGRLRGRLIVSAEAMTASNAFEPPG